MRNHLHALMKNMILILICYTNTYKVFNKLKHTVSVLQCCLFSYLKMISIIQFKILILMFIWYVCQADRLTTTQQLPGACYACTWLMKKVKKSIPANSTPVSVMISSFTKISDFTFYNLKMYKTFAYILIIHFLL